MCCLYDEQEEIFTKQIEMKSYQAESMMEMVHLDFPSLWSHTERGNEYILMLVDSFTKYHYLQRPPMLPQGQLLIFCFLRVWVSFQDLFG